MRESIWLNGRSNAEYGFLVERTSKRPGLPGTVDRTLSIPGRNGVWDFGADLGPLSFSFDCAMISRNPDELQQRIMALAAALVDSYGKPKELQLRLKERPNQYFTARYSGSFDPDRIFRIGKFSLPLVAFDPFARGDEKIEEVHITASPYTLNLQSSGNVRTEPVIILTNTGTTTLTSFRITNEYQIE